MASNNSLIQTLLCSSILVGCYAHADDTSLSGSYLMTGNISTIDAPITSMNHRIGLNFKPSWSKGNFDYRAESYTETSFHSIDGSIVNEHKFETQLNYSQPITDVFGVTSGMLYHTNYTFPDTYFWGVAGVTYNQSVLEKITLSAALLAEKRNGGGRIFYDTSGSIEYHIDSRMSLFAALHRYENLGEFDVDPSRKREYEIGVNNNISKRIFIGISYLHHTQDNDPTDRFSLLKLKLGVNF